MSLLCSSQVTHEIVPFFFSHQTASQSLHFLSIPNKTCSVNITSLPSNPFLLVLVSLFKAFVVVNKLSCLLSATLAFVLAQENSFPGIFTPQE